MKIFKDVLTGSDNETFDSGRVLCMMSHLVYFAIAFMNFLIGKTTSLMDFASGIATMAVGFGIHLYMKRDTEP